jgi:hypothetical protein
MKLGKPAQKGQMALPPRGDLVVVVAAGDRCRHNQQQNLRQRIAHLRRLARISNHRKMLKQAALPQLWNRLFHGRPPPTVVALHESHIPCRGNPLFNLVALT